MAEANTVGLYDLERARLEEERRQFQDERASLHHRLSEKLLAEAAGQAMTQSPEGRYACEVLKRIAADLRAETPQNVIVRYIEQQL